MQNVIVLSSHKKTAVQTDLRGQPCLSLGFWGEVPKEGGLGFPGLLQTGPWSALKDWPCDPSPALTRRTRGVCKGKTSSL